MKTRNTVILVLVAAALSAGIWWFERGNPGTREEAIQRRSVLRFERENITGITLVRGEERVELEKTGRRWEIAEPIEDRADPALMERLLSELEYLRGGEVIRVEGEEAKKRLKEFGVNRPKLRVKLRGEGAPDELRLGKETAVAGKIYARVGDAPEVHVISAEIKELVIRKAEDFRDRRLTDLDVGEVERMVIDKKNGEIALERPESRWKLVEPLKVRADDQKVTDWIAKVATLPVLGFCGAADKATAVHGFEEPRGTVSLFVESADQPAVLEIGSPVPGQNGKTFVRYAGRGGFYEVPSEPVDGLLKLEPSDLRDRKLLRLQPDVVDRIRIAPAGRPEVLLARRGEGWAIVGKEGERPADAAAVERMVVALQRAEVERFVADVVTSPAEYGLAEPELAVTFSSFASENTPETAAGERPFLRLELAGAQGAERFARVAEEGFVVSVAADLAESIPSLASEWQTAEVFQFDPGSVVSLKIDRAEGQDFKLAREPGGPWRIEEGAGVLDAVATQSLLNTLGSLRAVRWVGPETPAHGLAAPAFSLDVALDGGGLASLRVGAAGPDGTRFASASGKEGVFVLSGPDWSAFVAELLTAPGQAAPAAPAAPAVAPAAEGHGGHAH